MAKYFDDCASVDVSAGLGGIHARGAKLDLYLTEVIGLPGEMYHEKFLAALSLAKVTAFASQVPVMIGKR